MLQPREFLNAMKTFVTDNACFKQLKSRVDYGMRMEHWSDCERKRTTKSIKALVDAIEKYSMIEIKKRKKRDADEDDEEWHPRKALRSKS